jgi:hypothetical protein
MAPTRYALFHFDVKTMSMRDADGNFLSSANDAPLIFDNLDEAKRYSEAKIAATPELGCRIYDYQGQAVQTLSNHQLYDRYHGLPAAKRSLVIGALCLLAGVAGVTLDAKLGWRLIFGVLLGVRFLWVGTVKLIDGFSAWSAERPTR